MTLSSHRGLRVFSLVAFLLTLCMPVASFAKDTATIIHVVDGDTVEIMLKGQKEKVGVAALFWKKLRSVRYPFGAATPIPFL